MKLAKLPLSVALLVTVSWLVGCAPTTPTYAFNYAEQRAKLESNGLRVVVMPDKSTGLVEVDMRFEVGANEDPPGKAGIAHLVEHLMFLQRPDGPETPSLWDYANQMTTVLNAGTTWDYTHYLMEGTKENLDTLLKLNAMRLFYGCQTIRQEDFVREREVVRNEIRTRQGSPERQIYPMLLAAFYPKDHPYHHPVAGDDLQIASVELEDVCKFVKDYYVPERATLIVAGNVEFEEVIGLVKKWFAKIPRHTAAPRTPTPPVQVQKTQRIEKKLDIERTMVFVLWGLPGRGTKDFEAARFAVGMLAGQVSRFAEEWDFATEVDAGIITSQASPAFMVQVELKNDGDVGKALDFVWKAAKNAHRPFESGVFDDAKVHWRAQFVRQIESLMARSNEVADLIQYEKDMDFGSGTQYLIKEFEEIGKLDGGHVRGVVKNILKKDKAVVVVFRPDPNSKGKGGVRASAAYDPSTQTEKVIPEVDPKEAFTPLPLSSELSVINQAKRFELNNGMRVILLPFSTMPVATAQLMFDVGTAHESPSMAGLAAVAAHFLRHPPSGWDAMGRPRDAYGQTGTSFRGFVDDDTTSFVTTNINLYLEQMIRGLERLITAGEYNQEGLESYQKHQRFQLQSKRYLQQLTAGLELYKAVFGPDHPYAVNGTPTPKSVGKLNRDDAMAFKRKHYSAKNATIIVTGNFEVAKAEELIREHFGKWGGGHKDERIGPAQRQRTGPEHIGVIGRKDPQTYVQVAFPSAPGIDGQHGARLVLQRMLWQLMWDRMREKLGVTYGLHVQRPSTVGPSMYYISGDVDTERCGEALKGMRDAIQWLRDSKDEDYYVTFVRARRYIIAQLLRESSVSREMAMRLSIIAKFNLQPDYYDQVLRQVSAVSPALIKALIQQELRPEAEVVVLLSDRETMQKAFDENGIEQVKYVEPEYE